MIATIISTIRDNSHKERQNQKPPQSPKDNQQPKTGGFFEEIEKHLKKLMMRLMEKQQLTRKRNTKIHCHPLIKIR